LSPTLSLPPARDPSPEDWEVPIRCFRRRRRRRAVRIHCGVVFRCLFCKAPRATLSIVQAVRAIEGVPEVGDGVRGSTTSGGAIRVLEERRQGSSAQTTLNIAAAGKAPGADLAEAVFLEKAPARAAASTTTCSRVRGRHARRAGRPRSRSPAATRARAPSGGAPLRPTRASISTCGRAAGTSRPRARRSP
jgi:hypothetical protein